MKEISVPGRCRCQRVRYTLREEPIAFYLCHCTDCQAESGSAFGQTMHVRAEAITDVTGPTRDHRITDERGRTFTLTHCQDCLTVMWAFDAAIEQVRGLNAGSLEQVGGYTPYGNMWTRSARPWVEFAPGPQFEGQPEDPLAMIRAWQGRHST